MPIEAEPACCGKLMELVRVEDFGEGEDKSMVQYVYECLQCGSAGIVDVASLEKDTSSPGLADA